jgi:hypothetical protein
MHVDEQDEVALAVQQQRRQKPKCVGGLWEFIVASSMADVRIYRGDPTRVTASLNRLELYQTRTRHGLLAKINEKRKLQAYKGLGRISADHSYASHASTPFASPPLAQTSEARRTHVCFFLSPLLHTLTNA